MKPNKQLSKIDGISENDVLLDTAVRLQASSLATSLWQMLHPEAEAVDAETRKIEPGVQINDERSWDTFANHNIRSHQGSTKEYATVSLESFHDGIHGLIGTGNDNMKGHMGDPRWAGVGVALI